MNLTSKIANLWFADNQRVLATSIFGLAQPFGALFGFVLPSLFVNSNNSEEPIDQQKENFTNYLFV